MSEEINEPTLLRKAALARRFDVSLRTIDRWTKAGILPEPMKVGRTPYWEPDTRPISNTAA